MLLDMSNTICLTLVLFYNLNASKMSKIVQFDHTTEYPSKSTSNEQVFLGNKSKLFLTAISVFHPLNLL